MVKQALIPVEKKLSVLSFMGHLHPETMEMRVTSIFFVVTELSGLKLAELLGEVQNEIGRSINVSQFTADEFNQRKEQNDHFLKRVLEGPKINIFEHIHEP